jgi:hypothetical protein
MLQCFQALGTPTEPWCLENLIYSMTGDGELGPVSPSKLNTTIGVTTTPGNVKFWLQASSADFFQIGDPAESCVRSGKPFKVDPRSGKITRKLQMALKDCSCHHKIYNNSRDPPLPRRVINVSSSTPRLCLSGPRQRAEYVILSYCWGGPQEFTTTGTLKARSEGIPLPSLPQGMRDAIYVTRLFGFQYLWVDALCILQDRATDKDSEMANMGAIYKNSSLTIAAANSPSVKGGFLEDITMASACQLSLYLPNGNAGTVTFSCPDMDAKDPYPLDTRAWTLQEALLSRRTLYFGCDDVIWKCLTETTNLTKVNHWEPPFDDYMGNASQSLDFKRQNRGVKREKEISGEFVYK